MQTAGNSGALMSSVFEKKTTWLVYMMGALVGGHASAKPHRTDTEGAPTHVVPRELPRVDAVYSGVTHPFSGESLV